MSTEIVEGTVLRDMINSAVCAVAYDSTSILADRIRELEADIHHLKHQFNANLAREIAERCVRFVNDRELVGMTDEEFKTELERLLGG